ncbi:MAG: hypothetical protein UW69_C0047G0012 [Microgenomates group bacterium GW2011_GWA2_44_7]|nr:MAG: hypothetical protein UW69_C0047G0012 [Microgenomates group bacterium GW2011_GWA2_44_7]
MDVDVEVAVCVGVAVGVFVGLGVADGAVVAVGAVVGAGGRAPPPAGTPGIGAVVGTTAAFVAAGTDVFVGVGVADARVATAVRAAAIVTGPAVGPAGSDGGVRVGTTVVVAGTIARGVAIWVPTQSATHAIATAAMAKTATRVCQARLMAAGAAPAGSGRKNARRPRTKP